MPALAALVVQRPAHWAVLALPLLAGWLNATFVALTMHGWWWPGRQVVVVLPCVVLAVAWWAATRPLAVRALAVLGAVGASVFVWLVARRASAISRRWCRSSPSRTRSCTPGECCCPTTAT